MIYQGYYALRKRLREDHPDYVELCDDDQDIQMNDIRTLSETVSYRDVPKALSSSPLT